MYFSRCFSILLSIILAFSLIFSTVSFPVLAQPDFESKSSFVVNDAGDLPDAVINGTCATTAGKCTLRAAIMEANNINLIGSHTISFDGNYAIEPATDLPQLVDESMTITAVGHTVSITKSPGSSASTGLYINTNYCRIHNLTISGFTYNIVVHGSDNTIGVYGDGSEDSLEGNRFINSLTPGAGVLIASGIRNWVAGNKIGIDSAGNIQSNNAGILVLGSSTVIGTNSDGLGDTYERNIISGNLAFGINIGDGGGSTKIAGNIIGLKTDGTTAAGNVMGGVLISATVANNVRIGTDGNGVNDAIEANIISGNGSHGIRIDTGSGHKVSGNIIGLNQNGDTARGNTGNGIYIGAQAFNITIGVDETDSTYSANERNIISGNSQNGISIAGYQNTIAGNYIGTNLLGTVDKGNLQRGINISGRDNTIGTDGDGTADSYEGNVISGNDMDGILISGADADNTIIAGNIVGLDKNGDLGIANTSQGISLQNGPAGTRIGVGGAATGDSSEINTISGNGQSGISITAAEGATISGNYIGTNKTATADRGNSSFGIIIASGNNTAITIGVPDGGRVAQRNVISGNAQSGIKIDDADNHIIAGNKIGTNFVTDSAIPNDYFGILVNNSANIRIGTNGNGSTDSIEGNTISGNNYSGIELTNTATMNTVIAGNLIGLTGNGSTSLPNLQYGIHLSDISSGVRIGTDGNAVSDILERNTISGNGLSGIFIQSSGNLTISGNYIGTDIDGYSARGNSQHGISIAAGVSGVVTIGIPNGGTYTQPNLISGNNLSGIYITGSDNHIISGNYIGTDAEGGANLGNKSNGIGIENASNIRIGTDGNNNTDNLERNIISGNGLAGIDISGSESQYNVIAGNWIGLSFEGDSAIPNQSGISLQGGTMGNTIGTNADGVSDDLERNFISGNSSHGIWAINQSQTGVSGNVIGLSARGVRKVPNGGSGIWIGSDNSGVVTIGGGAYATRANIISGNSANGITIISSDDHIISGNFIGTDNLGTSNIGNNDNGIQIDISSNIQIGTIGDGFTDNLERNIISGNGQYGLNLSTYSAVVAGNYIGTDYTGTQAIPNNSGGMILNEATYNFIGMNSDGSPGEINEGNLIAGNNGHGIIVNGGDQNLIAGNFIGITNSGVSALPNQGSGVRIVNGAANDFIGSNYDGTNDELEGNIISGNLGDGVQIMDATTNSTILYGNIIGLGSDESTPLPNNSNGIYIADASGVKIGSTITQLLSNIISANNSHGIRVDGQASDTVIAGNTINSNINHGIYINSTASGSDIMAAKISYITQVASNQIHNNGAAGVYVDMLAGNGHLISSNSFRQNGGLGIDLFPSGVTMNDDMDGDSGPNGLQNHPVLESISFPSTGNIRITGSFNSTPSTTFTIQVYAGSEVDPSGFGEGQTLCHTFTVTTESNGSATFDQTNAWALGLSQPVFSAIAIAPDGSTSEFGPAMVIETQSVFLPLILR